MRVAPRGRPAAEARWAPREEGESLSSRQFNAPWLAYRLRVWFRATASGSLGKFGELTLNHAFLPKFFFKNEANVRIAGAFVEKIPRFGTPNLYRVLIKRAPIDTD
jgi:hypothetical protein